MTDLALDISDETEAVHSAGSADKPKSASYTVACDALEVLGGSYVQGDIVKLPRGIASTLLQLNQVTEVK